MDLIRTFPEWIRDGQDHTEFEVHTSGGYQFNWVFMDYEEEALSDTTLVSSEQFFDYYLQTFQKTMSRTWWYDYTKYAWTPGTATIVEGPEIQEYNEIADVQWEVILTAEEVAQQNAEEIAKYGPPPNARVVNSQLTVNGETFTSDMIYGKKTRDARAAALKAQMDEHLGEGKSKLSKALDWLQTGLDFAGLIPGIGEIADGVNAVIYLARSDYANAALAGAAMIPFAGWFATGGKMVNKVDNALDAYREAEHLLGSTSKFIDDAKDISKQTGKPLLDVPVSGDNIGSFLRGSDKGTGEVIEETGIVYKRTNLNNSDEVYIGQTKSDERFVQRQKEHARNNPNADYDFEIVGRAKPGKDLDVLEQQMINDHGGIQREGGILENKRNQISRDKWDMYGIK